MHGTQRRRILHLHSTFNLGGKEARDVALINYWGDRFEHVIVSAEPGAYGACALIERAVPFRIAEEAPALAGPNPLARLAALGRYIAQGRFDLVLSFNWGAMDAVLANRLLARRPLVHHEDGFNEDEIAGQKPARLAMRRLVLPGAARLVVPSRTLERIARRSWRLSPAHVAYVPNGIDARRFRRSPAPDAIPGLVRREGEVVVGTLAGLRRIKNLPRLVRAFAGALGQPPGLRAQLVIVGQGPEAEAIRAEAVRTGVAERLVMPGFLPHPHQYVGLFDIFALSSDSEQFPISLVEAMAAGLPAVSTRVGDVAEIVANPNVEYLAPPEDEADLARALAALMRDGALRRSIGEANRARVEAEFTREAMIARYEEIYAAAMAGGRSLAPRG